MKEWRLTREAFDGLLLALDPDRERAGNKYERLREKLTFLFEHRGCASSSDLVDEAFDRVARRLVEGEPIRDVVGFMTGVAHNLIKERWRDKSERTVALVDLRSSQEPVQPADAVDWPSDAIRGEGARDCLACCLTRLKPADREMIRDYYQNNTRANKENRQRLAQRLGIPLNALRLRAYRVRLRLESCVNSCLERQGGLK